MWLRFRDDRIQEAMLLAIGNNSMRVSLAGDGDASEVTLQDGQWIFENGEPVEIEFLAPTAGDASNVFLTSSWHRQQLMLGSAKLLQAGLSVLPSQ